MNPLNFEKWNELAKPFQAIAELNFKTLQNLSYIKPEELQNLRKPEELLEKQMKVAIENGQNALNYMQKSFQIIEQAMAGLIQEGKKTEKAAEKASEKAASNFKK